MKWSWLAILAFCAFSSAAQAQGLIWSLPEDGHFVRYEGTYTQFVKRPDSTQGNLNLQWRRTLTIKSVGREEQEYQGKTQPCRWIEIKTETGKTAEGVLDAGPGGVRMYKLLVPEAALRGTVNEPVGEGREIFASYVPIVKGFRRIGDEPAQEIPGHVFQLYPVVCLLQHYRNLTPAGSPASINVPAGDFEATEYKGEFSMETPSYRSVNTCTLFRSPGLPFGVVKWSAKTQDETKGTTDLRTEFKESVTMSEEMQAVATGDGAESEFLMN
jgi:hypothetical protein